MAPVMAPKMSAGEILSTFLPTKYPTKMGMIVTQMPAITSVIPFCCSVPIMPLPARIPTPAMKSRSPNSMRNHRVASGSCPNVGLMLRLKPINRPETSNPPADPSPMETPPTVTLSVPISKPMTIPKESVTMSVSTPSRTTLPMNSPIASIWVRGSQYREHIILFQNGIIIIHYTFASPAYLHQH